MQRFESSEPPTEVTCPRCSKAALEFDHHDVCYISAIDVSGVKENLNADDQAVSLEEEGGGAHVFAGECAALQREKAFC